MLKNIFAASLLLGASILHATTWDPLSKPLQIQEDRLIFDGLEYEFGEEQIIDSFGERSRRHIGKGGEVLYQCVISSVQARKISDGIYVILKMTRTQFSESRGYLCGFIYSLEGLLNPTAFEYLQLTWDEEKHELIQMDRLIVENANSQIAPAQMLREGLWNDPKVLKLQGRHIAYSRQF